VDSFLPLAVKRHAQAVTKARQTHTAVDLHHDMAGLDIAACSIVHAHHDRQLMNHINMTTLQKMIALIEKDAATCIRVIFHSPGMQ